MPIKENFVHVEAGLETIVPELDTFMLSHRFCRIVADHCRYIRKFLDGNFVVQSVYVDDMLEYLVT